MTERGFRRSASTARRLRSAGGWLLAGAADTGGALTVIESVFPPDDEVPSHRHLRMDEAVYVLDGRFTVTCGDDVFEATAGDFVRLPRGVPHAITAGPDGGRQLILATPGGFEGFFDGWDGGMSLRQSAQLHHVEFLDGGAAG